MPPGEILHCTAQSWLIFTRLAKITSSYTIDSERGAAGLTKTGGIQAQGTRCRPSRLFFRQKRRRTRRPGAGGAGIRHA